MAEAGQLEALIQHLHPPSPTRAVPDVAEVLHTMSLTISGLLGHPSDVCSLRQVCKGMHGALVQVVGRVESTSYMVRRLFGSGIIVQNLDLVHTGAHWNFGDTTIPLQMNLWQYEIESDNRGGLRPLLPSGEPVTQIHWLPNLKCLTLRLRQWVPAPVLDQGMMQALKSTNIVKFVIHDLWVVACWEEFMSHFPPSTTHLTFVTPVLFTRESQQRWHVDLGVYEHLQSLTILNGTTYDTSTWKNFHKLKRLAMVEPRNAKANEFGVWGLVPDMNKLCKQSTGNQIWALTHLRLVNCRLYKLDWLEHLPELSQLDISYNGGIMDLSPLSGCLKLEFLDLRWTISCHESRTMTQWDEWMQSGMKGWKFQGCVVFLQAEDRHESEWSFGEMDTANMAFSDLRLILQLSTYSKGDNFIRLDYEHEVVGRVLRSTVFSQCHSDVSNPTAMITCFKRAPGGDFLTSPSGALHANEPPCRLIMGGLAFTPGYHIRGAWYTETDIVQARKNAARHLVAGHYQPRNNVTKYLQLIASSRSRAVR